MVVSALAAANGIERVFYATDDQHVRMVLPRMELPRAVRSDHAEHGPSGQAGAHDSLVLMTAPGKHSVIQLSILPS